MLTGMACMGTLISMDTARLDLVTDFGVLDDTGRLRAKRLWFEAGAELVEGTLLRVGDPDDALWSARVVEAGPEWLVLELVDPLD